MTNYYLGVFHHINPLEVKYLLQIPAISGQLAHFLLSTLFDNESTSFSYQIEVAVLNESKLIFTTFLSLRSLLQLATIPLLYSRRLDFYRKFVRYAMVFFSALANGI